MAIKFLNTVAVDTNVLYVDPVLNQVGINTTDGGYALRVNGQIYSEASTYPVFYLKRNTSATGGSFSTLTGIASSFKLETDSTGTITDGFGGGIVFSIGDTSPNTAARIYARRDGGDQSGAIQFWGGVDGNTLFTTMRASGNVGIGTEAPAEKLVVSEARSGTNAAAQTKYTLVSRSTISSGTPGTGGIKVVYDDGSNEHSFGLVSGSTSADFLTSGPMHWFTNSDLNTHNATGFAMTIDTSQRVGIGTTNPSTLLQLSGTGGNASGLSFSNTSGEIVRQYFSDANADSDFFITYDGTGGAEITLQHDGDLILNGSNGDNVGIGTSSPVTKLQVGDGTADTRARVYFSDGTYTELTGFGVEFNRNTSYLRPTANNSKTLHVGWSNARWATLSFDATDTIFNTDGVERMRIDSSGSLKITNTGAAKLILRGDSNNSGDSGNLDGIIDFLHDDGTYGYRLNTENYAGYNAFHIQDYQNSQYLSRIYIAQNGNVGIGTTGPDAKLHVEGSLLVDAYNVGVDSGIFLREGFLTTDQPSITVWDMSNSGASPDGLSLNAQDGIRFREDGGEVARFKNGFFGINKTSPATMLHVEGDTTLDRKTQLRLPSFSMGASSITDEYLVIARKHDGSSTKINATGIQGTITFGRGSTSSGNKSAIYTLSVQSAYNGDLVEEFSYVGGTQVFTSLDVIDVGGTEYYALKVMTTGGGQIDNRCYAEGLLLTDGDSNIFSKVRVSDSNVSLVTSGVLLPLRYKTMSEGVARIQSPSGYVEIGPQNSSYSHFSTDRSRFYFNKRIVVDEGIISTYNEQMQLQAPLGTTRMYLNNLNGNCSIGVQDSNARLTLKGPTGTGESNLLRIMSETAFTSTPGRMIEFFRSNGDSRGNIYMNQYGIGTSSSSDYRLKKNISLISDGIDRVKLLKPSRFSWIEGPDDYFQDGFIAHEVEQVVPEAIAGDKDDVDSNGEPIYQGIDQVKIVPLLTAALKEAIAKIENLETRIQTLENN